MNKQNPDKSPQKSEEHSQEKIDQEKREMQKRRVFPLWPLLLLLLLWAVLWMNIQPDTTQIPYSVFKTQLKKGNVDYLEAKGETLRGEFKEPITINPPTANQLLLEQMKEEQAKESSAEQQTSGETQNTQTSQNQSTPQDTSTEQQTGSSKQADQSNQEQEKIEMFKTTLPPFADENLISQIEKQNVEFVSYGSADQGWWVFLLNLLPILLLIGIGIVIFRGFSQQAGGIMQVGKSRAKKFEKEKSQVRFDDVAGLKEAKDSLKEVVSFLKEPQRFAQMGCRVPTGLLLVGPPGTGKTLLARAVAGEADTAFFSITGSDFMEMFVGIGASRVRDLFKQAKQNMPCIIFLDELDSIGRQRGAGLGGGHDEREQTLNQLLSEIDGFEPTENIVVMAATNRPDILDPALQRPGRFDRRVVVDLPSYPERVEILKVHSSKVPLSDDVDLEEVARSMPGQSGADLDNLVNEATLIAAKKGKNKVDRSDFEQARDQILMGRTRSGVKLQGHEKHAIALHEAGHALIAHLIPEADPVQKVSIIPRGRALGATQQLPEERYNLTKEQLLAIIKTLLGGRVSEDVIIGTISNGAADDLNKVSSLARRMVSQWGMSEKFKHMAFGDGNPNVFLGEQISQQRPYSEETQREIDIEIKSLVNDCYEEVKSLIQKHRGRLERLAQVLEEEEVLEGERLKQLLDGDENSSEPAGEEMTSAQQAQQTEFANERLHQ